MKGKLMKERVFAWVRDGAHRVVSLAVVIVAVTSVMSPTAARADDDTTLNLYTLSSNVTAFFSNQAQPGAEIEIPEGWSTIFGSTSSGGSVLGYGDNDLSATTGWLSSWVTGSSNTVSFDTLQTRNDDGEGNEVSYTGALEYAQYGALLSELGIDETGSGLLGSMSSFIGGGIMLAAFMLSLVVDLLFAAVLALLKLLNPFRFFVDAFDPQYQDVLTGSGGTSIGSAAGDGLVSWVGLNSFTSWVSGWYSALSTFSWTVMMPIFFGIFVVFALLFRATNVMDGLKKLVIRGVYLAFGIPLLGGFYTAALNSMGDLSGGGAAGSVKVIMSTYVDFEDWAMRNRLYVPEGATLEWNATRGYPSEAAQRDLRGTASMINGSANPYMSSFATPPVSKFDSVIESAVTSDKETYVTDSGELVEVSDAVTILASREAIEMVMNHMLGKTVAGSDFDTAIKGDLSKLAADGNDKVKKCAAKWFSVSAEGTQESNDCGTVVDNPLIYVPNGLSATDKDAEGDITFTSSSIPNCGTKAVDDKGNPRNCNLSPLAMYNYLNSSFTNNSITTYSSSKATSGATREVHYSTTLIGSGIMAASYWLNSLAVMVSFVVLGFAYALAIPMGVIRNSIKMISSIVFSGFGSIAAIAKVIVYTVSMVVIIMGTMFMYQMAQIFILTTPSLFESTIAGLVQGTITSGIAFISPAGTVLPFAIQSISTIIIAMLTVMMLRVRVAVVRGITEALTNSVEKLMGVNVPDKPSGMGGALGSLGRGVSGGVGMYAAQQAMDKGAGALGGMFGAKGDDGQGGQGGAAGASGVTYGGTDDHSDPNPQGGGSGGGGDDGGNGGGAGGAGGGTDLVPFGHDERVEAAQIEANGGLSGMPTGTQGQDRADQVASSVDQDSLTGDVSAGMQDSFDDQKKARESKKEAAKAQVKVGAKVVEAGARAYVGDTQGAVQAGVEAKGQMDSVKSHADQAKRHSAAADGSQGRGARSQKRQQQQQRQQQCAPNVPQRNSGTPSVPQRTSSPAQQQTNGAQAPAQSGSSGTRQRSRSLPTRGSTSRMSGGRYGGGEVKPIPTPPAGGAPKGAPGGGMPPVPPSV